MVSGKRKRIRRAVYDECNRQIQVLTVAELRKTVITFRCLTEFPSKHKGKVGTFILNFACTGHFGGAWDADCGRQCAKCFNCEKAAGCKQGKGELLPTPRAIVEYLEQEMSITEKKRREQAGGKAVENKNYTVNRRFFVCWDKQNPMPKESGDKEADAIIGA